MAKTKQTAVTDEEIIAALIASGTITEAAAKVGISARTIYDRMATKDFKALYHGAKTDIIRAAVLKINKTLTDAIETVSEIMTDKEVNPATRLQAAQTIIGNAAKFSERLQREEHSNIENNVKDIFNFEL